MRKNNCETVRRELDELMLGESYSAAAEGHLRECSECREFQEKQTRLRQMVGSLGTVAAPADFDFRLRARLANESSNAVFHLNSASWFFARRSLTVAALILLIATGVVVVRNLVNQKEQVEITGNNQPATPAPPQPGPTAQPQPRVTVGREEAPVIVRENAPPRSKPERSLHAGMRRRNIVSEDLSSTRAGVLGGVNSSEAFSIDASLESFKVSLDDGRGNARTISLPAIRFGSQRMLPTANQYAVKGVW